MYATIRDVYQAVSDRYGTATPVRTLDEVRAYLQARRIRYEDADEAISEMFDSGWAYDLEPDPAPDAPR